MSWMVARALLVRWGSDPGHEGADAIRECCCGGKGLHAADLPIC